MYLDAQKVYCILMVVIGRRCRSYLVPSSSLDSQRIVRSKLYKRQEKAIVPSSSMITLVTEYTEDTQSSDCRFQMYLQALSTHKKNLN